jgi:hypothetical protein
MRTTLLVLALCILLVGAASPLAAAPTKKTADFLNVPRAEVMRAVVQTAQEDYVLVYVNKEDFAVTFNTQARFYAPLTVTVSVAEVGEDGKVRVTLSIQARDGGTNAFTGGIPGSGGAAKKFFAAVNKRLAVKKKEQ